jgi:hypothetical protein
MRVPAQSRTDRQRSKSPEFRQGRYASRQRSVWSDRKGAGFPAGRAKHVSRGMTRDTSVVMKRGPDGHAFAVALAPLQRSIRVDAVGVGLPRRRRRARGV